MEIQSEECINCMLCVNVCPLMKNAISMTSTYPNTFVNLDRDPSEKEYLIDINYYCLSCQQCKVVCPRNLEPTKAIMIIRKELINTGPKKEER